MKNYLLILLLFASTCSFGQGTDLEFTTIKHRPKTFQFFGTISIPQKNARSASLFLGIDSNTTKISNTILHPTKKNTYFIYLENAKRINLNATISPKNIGRYTYNVVNGEGVQIGAKDQKPSLEIYNFGTYDIDNQNLIISVQEKDTDFKNTRTLIICNKKLPKPQILEALLVKELEDKPTRKIKKNEKGEVVYVERLTKTAVKLGASKVQFSADRSYALLNIKPIDYIFLYKIIIKYRDGKNNLLITKIDNLNWYNDADHNLNCKLDIKNFEKPGEYEIILYPKIKELDLSNLPTNATFIKFGIKKTGFFNSTKNLMYVGLISIIFVVICFITIIVLIKAKNKNRLEKEKQLKSKAKIELDSIRSQLNPHFMFNALAGIQNLMNKDQTEEANSYLGKFARLTRNVLDQKEVISLAEERDLLTDYLQMEQLRFGFNYEIFIDETLDVNNIEIPPMLLQPLVENAVKHGIAEKENQGKVDVLFQKNKQNLVLKVIDNGKGFESDKNYQGLGLQLTKNRITLLNDIYSSTPIILSIKSNSSGTKITLTLSQWL